MKVVNETHSYLLMHIVGGWLWIFGLDSVFFSYAFFNIYCVVIVLGHTEFFPPSAFLFSRPPTEYFFFICPHHLKRPQL